MSLAVGPYGIEYDPRQRDSGSPGIRRLIIFILVVAAISLFVTLVKRAISSRDASSVDVANVDLSEREVATAKSQQVVAKEVQDLPQPEILADVAMESRPVKVRNLLLRLEEAEKRRDIAMAVTTIEQICSLPGDPAHDLYDKLYRRAGELNIKWLFEEKNAQWVSEVQVKSGDSASRLANRNGSTLSSLAKLNPKTDIECLKVGEIVYVMTRPRFILIIHSRTRTADLKLNGRFFKRYDLSDDVSGAVGSYEIESPVKKFLASKGVFFGRDDRAEVEMLIPKGSLLVISEM